MRKIIALPVCALMTAAFLVAVSAPASAKPICTPSTVAEADALRMAAACKSKVEIQGLRTEKEKFFANPDGSQSFEISAVPVRIRKDGVLQDIDTTLKQGKDGRWAPKAAVEASFSDGGDSPFVMSNVDGNRFGLSWPTALAKPKVDGGTLTYPGVLPDVDLAVTVTRTGYTYVLVVKTAAAAANPALTKISYRVSGDLEARNGSGGSIELVDKLGQVTSVGSHASSMWDSAADPALGGEVLPELKVDLSKIPTSTMTEPGPAARVRHVEARAEGGNLVVTPDADLLKNGTLPLFIDPPLDRYRTGWAYAHSTNGNWTPGEHARVGRNPDDGTLFRSFFEFSMSGIQGVQILNAQLNINLDHNSACAGNTAYLYRSDGIGGANGTRVAWSHGIAGPLSSAWGDSNEAGGCGSDQGDDPLVFSGTSFTNDVQYGSSQGWGTYTLGLCMCTNTSGANESGTYQWMKFHHGQSGTPVPVLAGNYNRPPGTPANLTTSAVACGGTIGTTSPVLSAQFVDPDGSDTLSSTFYWKELPSGSTNTVAGPSKPANNYGTVTLSLGAGAEGKTYAWQVKTSDGISATQPYSPWCNFTVNASPPPLPGVSSSAYPADGVSHGSPGLPGVFTLTNGGTAGQDVISYTYGWTDPPTTTVSVSAGASANVTLSPPKHGYNTLHVFSKDPAGTPGPTKHYQFLTNTPAAPLGHWPLDDIGGHGFSDQIGSSPFTVDTVSNDVTWMPDVRYVGSNAVSLNAVAETPTDLKGVLKATGSGFDTSGSFSASVWVRMTPQTSCTNLIAVSVDGAVHNGFSLGYNCWGNNWRFGLPEKDVHSAAIAYASSTSVPVFNRWTNLTAVWDEPASKMRLFVDGVLEADVTPPAAWLANRGTGWAATGPVIAGRGLWNYLTDQSEWQGEIADIRLWNRAVSAEDLTGTNADAVAGTQAVPGILQPVQVGNWNFNDYDSLDGSYWSRHMTLTGNATYADPGHDGNTAVQLDGVSGDTNTNGLPILRTDQSFTMSAWVKVNSTGTSQTVMMQGTWPFWSAVMSLNGTTGKWSFGISNDLGGGNYGWVGAESNAAATANVWTHLTGVFDRSTGQTRLYVNGVEQTVKGTGGVGWYGSNSLHIGSIWSSSDLLAGQIDQVKLYQGAMTAREVANLYAETN